MRWVFLSLDASADQADVARRFWSAATGWSLGEAWDGHPEFRSFDPRDGDGYAIFQVVDDERPTATVHFDFTTEDMAGDIERLTALGASTVDFNGRWQVMRSPGGVEFCLVNSSGTTVPSPVKWDGGQRSRIVQLCIDSPAAVHDDEVAFWKAATGWRFMPGESPEFAGKLYPPDKAPIQFLLQRLGDDDDRTTTSVHIDIGTDDREAEVRRLEQLGATRGEPGGGWTQMSDPTGMVFCVTDNPPD